MMIFLNAFLTGGILCMIGQVLLDKTGLTPARILTLYVVSGVVLHAIGIYQPIAEWAGAGASVPLTGFGNLLAKGVRTAIRQKGALGILTGGLEASAGGICCAVVSAFLMALLFRAKSKN